MRSTKPLVRGERCAVLDALHSEQQFLRVALGLAAEVAAIVGQHGTDGEAEVLVEGQHAVVHQVARRDRHLRRVTFAKAKEHETSTMTCM